MQVSHKVSFQIGAAFEQHSADFTLEDKDLTIETFHSLNLLEKMFIMNVLVVIEGLLFQNIEGYISNEEFLGRRTRIKSLMSPKLVEVLNSLLRGKSE